jgi:hypothetical protein
MTTSDILFQYHTTTTASALTTADLVYVATDSGQTLVRSLFMSPTNGATNNIVRMHHCGPDETPTQENCLMRCTVSKDDTLTQQYFDLRLLLNAGDRLFAQLHAGNGVTITGYGLVPGPNGSSVMTNMRHEDAYGPLV